MLQKRHQLRQSLVTLQVPEVLVAPEEVPKQAMKEVRQEMEK